MARPSLAALLLLAAACRGELALDPNEPQACEIPAVGAPVPLRRLTAVQLANTVNAALGVRAHYPIADEQILGFRANTTLSLDPTTARAVQVVAEDTAAAVTRDLLRLPGCTPSDCADVLLDELSPLLFRRPLGASERAPFHAAYQAGLSQSPGAAVQWLVETMLQSPRFLYQLEHADPEGRLDGYSVASRLSFALWNAPPDRALLSLAERGELTTPAQVRAAASTMIDDPRFDAGLESFVAQWLHLESLQSPDQRPDVYALPPDVRAALSREPVRYVARAIRDGHDPVELLTSDTAPSEPALDALYGQDLLSVSQDTSTFDPARRGGLLTLASVQAALGHAGETSPTRRGTVVLAQVLCRPPAPPPAGVVASLPPATQAQTTRERFEQHFADPSCASCHATIDGIGFAYEHYDPLGRYRTHEGPHPIDAASSFELLGAHYDVADAIDLGVVLGEHPETARCIARQLTRLSTGLPDSAQSRCLASALGESARGPQGLRGLVLDLVSADWFLLAPPELPR